MDKMWKEAGDSFLKVIKNIKNLYSFFDFLNEFILVENLENVKF